MSPLQFIDVSGVGNSGKSAVVDLLREVEGLFVPEYWFEFDLIRVPGGLLDLRHHLYEDWSPVRSHAAFHAFLDVVEKMGVDPSPWDVLAVLKSTSQRYDHRFKGRFVSLSREFVASFKIGSYRAEWPYDDLHSNALLRLLRKLLRRAGLRKHLTREVLLLDGGAFDQRAEAYLNKLYREIVPEQCLGAVLNNGFEPFNPLPGLDMVAGSRQLVITRDPRDVYVSGLNFHNVSSADAGLLAFDNDGMNKSFLATDNLELFVKRYRLYHQNLFQGTDPRVMHIPFETLIRDAKNQVPNILKFLEIDPVRHVRPNTHFVPERSAKNVGNWRHYSRKSEIRYIEEQLGDYLVDA